MRLPKPEEIKAARIKLLMTQKEAAALIGVDISAWQRYEAGERKIHSIIWRVWRIRAKLDSPESILRL